MDYKNINDYETLYMIKENDDSYRQVMFNKYHPLIVSLANRFIKQYNYINVDINDLIAEGNLALNSAIDSYDERYNTKFYTYCMNIITRKYISYIKALIVKNSHYNYISLDEIDYDVKYNYDDTKDRLNMIMYKDLFLRIKNNLIFINSCIFELTCNGFNSIEISKLLDMSVNSIRSRQYRIRQKVKEMTD